jgi:hypothetical protein
MFLLFERFLTMSGHNTAFEMYQSPLSQPVVTATTGTIAADRNPCYIKVDTTAGAAALTLARPTKAGVFCAVSLETDGGDLVLTPTGGYNIDGSPTTITFNDAGEMVMFYSIDVGGTLRWSVVGHEGTNVAIEDLTVDQATITTGTVTTLASTTATIQDMARPAVLTAEHGAGAIGTAFAPRTYRYTREGVIITEIHVDLTGLACKGDLAKDAIGLAAGGDAYIGRYVVATCGVVFRIEMICVELPGEGTATITADIDLGAENDSDVAYDGPVDDVVINTASLVAGEMASTDVPALTANDYLYLVEGDTAATTGVYNAGQYIIRMYGHALLA